MKKVICGIYKIENKETKRCYIGQSVDIERRFMAHKSPSAWKRNYPLYEDFMLYGIDAFSFEVIEECEADVLDEREKYWISQYGAYKDGYNQTVGGSGISHFVKLSDSDLEQILSLLKTTQLTQNEIAKKFNVGIDTISEINNGKTRKISSETYPVRQREDKVHCPNCGRAKANQAKFCKECSDALRQKVRRPSKDQLLKDITSLTFVDVGTKYGVSDSAVKKWCKRYGLPSKRSEL